MSDGAADAESSRNFARYNNARAALSLHLLAYPVGEPVGFFQQEADGSVSRVSSEYRNDPDVFPLYRNPKESA
jgi:hypothetical protein